MQAQKAIDALRSIPPDLPREEWHEAGRAAIAAGLSVDQVVEWSRPAHNFKNEQDVRSAFRTITPEGGTGPATLFHLAAKHGCREEKLHRSHQRRQTHPNKPAQRGVSDVHAQEIWDRCETATAAHPYIRSKDAEGVSVEGLRVVSEGDPLRIMGESMTGALVLPVVRPDGTLSSLQFITPPETAERLRARGKTTKPNLPGASLQGWLTVGELAPGGVAYLCEGIGAAWACYKATGAAAVVCFGWGRVKTVAQALRNQDAEARLVLVPDVGKELPAAEIAREVGAEVATMPEGWPQNSDVCDLAQRDGLDALEVLLTAATNKPVRLPLDVVFADELPKAYEAPDELVQGVLTAGAGSMLYGDSNSGKTFFTIDLACAVARGVPWMGRRTEQGLVVYVAAESPSSVKSRLQAYQAHHGCTVPDFAIVQNPLDLHSGDTDAEALIAMVRILERQRGRKVRLIVGDTLARLSAGANENSGEHMGLVVQRIDRIREECAAHVLLIHHSGKAAANGARGWSGIRAAVDTEIEVTDALSGRCAEFTKQRDLPTRGQRVGFRLESVAIGVTKWGDPATTCVVVPEDAPAREVKGKKVGAVEGAVLEFLTAKRTGVKKSAVVSHFDGRYEKGPVYRAIKALVAAMAVHEAAGMVCIAEAAK